MLMKRPQVFKVLRVISSVILFGIIFYFNALHNVPKEHHQNMNFFTFWLPGHMLLEGENPYNEAQWLDNHVSYGVTWIPNSIFPYPLPLAGFLIPLGLLSFREALFVWGFISQSILAISVYLLLFHWKDSAQRNLFPLLVIGYIFFGPVYLTLRTGSIGTFPLGILILSILLIEKEKSLLMGIVLSLLILKPPQGLPILILSGVWLLARSNWKAILGMVIGGLLLLFIGILIDPLWVPKFIGAGQAVLDRTLGNQSNVWSYSYLFCHQAQPCTNVLGMLGTLLLLGWGSFFLWRNHAWLTPWETFNIIIPIGFVSSVYLWMYDQLPYIIPITWIAAKLVEKTKTYIFTFLFLIVLEVIPFFLLAQLATTGKDLWNISITVIVLGTTLWLLFTQHRQIQSVGSNQ
jgi:Glycosyltransferase family 87